MLHKRILCRRKILGWRLCCPTLCVAGLRWVPTLATASCAWAIKSTETAWMDVFESPRCAMVSGFSVHANVCIEARDRMRLQRLIRYAARPAVSTERLTELSDGRLLYRLKRPWRDGTTAVLFEKQDFMAKLAVLVPAPRAHLTRYHGLLAPAAVWRPLIIPTADCDFRQNVAKAATLWFNRLRSIYGLRTSACVPPNQIDYTNCPNSLRGRMAVPNCDVASRMIGRRSWSDLARPGVSADLTRCSDG